MIFKHSNYSYIKKFIIKKYKVNNKIIKQDILNDIFNKLFINPNNCLDFIKKNATIELALGIVMNNEISIDKIDSFTLASNLLQYMLERDNFRIVF